MSQTSDTTLEEFLEELDALTDADWEDQKHHDPKTELSPSPDSLNTTEEVSGSTVLAGSTREDSPSQQKAEASSPRGTEKKVRFSEELIQGAHARHPTGFQDSSEARGPSSLKASSPKKNEKHGAQQPPERAKQDDGSPQDKGGGPSAPPAAQQQDYEIECSKEESDPLTAPGTSPAESSVQPVELAKCNISNTGML